MQSHLGPLHDATGIPMECVVLVETEDDRTLLVHGSYHASFRLYDKLIVTDRDTYLFDTLAATLRTREGTAAVESEQDNAAGPSAWDGYAATAVSDAALEALRTGARQTVSMRERPGLYAVSSQGRATAAG